MPIRALLALGLGILAALSMLVAAERWQRSREKGAFELVDDLKFARPARAGRDAPGWVEGRSPPARRPGVRRVLCVGDSVTEGAGVGARFAWPARLREALGEEGTEIWNFGVYGWDAAQVATLLETRLGGWEPDAVVWGSYANDIFPTYMVVADASGDTVFVGAEVPAGAALLPSPLGTWLLGRSALYRRAQAAAFLRWSAQGGEPRSGGAWYAEQVDRLERWSAQSGVPVLVLAIPSHRLAGPCSDAACREAERWHATVTAALDEHAALWMDGLDAWEGRGPFDLPGSTDADHPNAEAHALLGRFAAPAVEALLPAATVPERAARRRPR